MNVIRVWFQRHFSDPQVVILAVALVALFAVVLLLGGLLAPVLASLVMAYLLEGVVSRLERLRVPRLLGVLFVFTVFMAGLVLLLFGLLPMVYNQILQLVQQVPAMISLGQQALLQLPERYPEVVSEDQILHVMSQLRAELPRLSQRILSWSVASARGLFMLVVYLVLMPLMVFFFLKDKRVMLAWSTRFLPARSSLAARVWRDVDRQIGNYIRGKAWEILIVGVVAYATFRLLDLSFAVLLALFVGLSVLVPYIGATVMTLPVVLIAYFDFGFGPRFLYVLAAYGILQLLDGNLLAPVLVSEVTNLHPVAILAAVMVFGGLWGFWGVFFAVPLATLVQSVLSAWPRRGSGPDAEARAGP